MGSSLARVRSFPPEPRREVGYQLFRLQLGLNPSDYRPMKAVGRGVEEIRIHTGGEYRVLYTARLSGCVYVLNAFGKKTSKTPRLEIELAASRYRRLLCERKDARK